jgi:hypothetical protein
LVKELTAMTQIKSLKEIRVGDYIRIASGKSCGSDKEFKHLKKNGEMCSHHCNCMIRVLAVIDGSVHGMGACGHPHYIDYNGDYLVAEEETALSILSE